MDLLKEENIVAVATAAIGVIASVVLLWFERRVPRRKRIGYRVQMDSPIGDEVRSGRANVRLGLFDEGPDMAGATLVLLRIENDGSQSIGQEDYTSAGPEGLTAVFAGRTIRGVSVTHPVGAEHLMDHFTPGRAFGYEGNRLRIPRVPLNRHEHYKLLVLLTGGDVGAEIRLTGAVNEGEVHTNRAVPVDEAVPLLSRPAQILTGLLVLSVVALSALIVNDDPTPTTCESGELTLTGSTAFEPVIAPLARRYEEDCEGAEIRVEARGSEAGVAELDTLGDRDADAARSVIAFSDGPMGDRWNLYGERIALSVFTLVVHSGIDPGPEGLTTSEVRRLYAGDITRWSQLNAGRDPSEAQFPNTPVVLVSRGDTSGTRQILQQRVLGEWEQAPSTGLDCDPPTTDADIDDGPVTRCEVASTEDVLSEVAAHPGALGYSELALATGADGVRPVALNGDTAAVAEIESGESNYPYRDVEYAYTYGSRAPSTDTLAGSFLAYLNEEDIRAEIRKAGHLPCRVEDQQLCM
ncbi:PstS family phosphate ABC transporter substrate-binding protein [Streptomyces sp. NPDC056716]|uniref:PstS family phosphate ABC transporter substrate-binding protein n=1 Tax=unclassified Streptomyces TaxID=2593676 RepID=UPI00367AEF5E